MRCEAARELLSEKLDGALTPEQERALAQHLEVCPDCRRIFAAYQQLDADLAGMAAEPPAQLKTGVMAQIAGIPQMQTVRKKRPLWGVGTLAAAAAVLALLIGTGTVKLPSWDSAGASEAEVALDVAKASAGADFSQVTGAAAAEADDALPEAEFVVPEDAGEDTASGSTDMWSPESMAADRHLAFDLDDYVVQQTQPVLVLEITPEQVDQVLWEWGQMDELEIPASLAQWQPLGDGVWLCEVDADLLAQIQSLYGGTLYQDDADTPTAQLILMET